MPRLAICSRDLHWQWINWALLYNTMEVSMPRLAWLTIAQHVFQPALTGRLELISRKIASCEPGTKAIAVSKFREKLSPANWVQGVTAISRKISRSWVPKKWGPTCDRDISNSAIYTTAIYREYTVYKYALRMETMKQSGMWSSLGTHGSVVVIWWLCNSSSGETRKFDFLNQIWPWRSRSIATQNNRDLNQLSYFPPLVQIWWS